MKKLSISEQFKRLGTLFPRPKRISPEQKYVLELTNTKLSVTAPKKHAHSVQLKNITSIEVETNDSGPWGSDVWFIIYGQNDKEFCAYPMGAINDVKALDYFLTLPGFELKGMDCTENKRFVCWSANT